MKQIIYKGESNEIALYGERCVLVGIIPSLTETREGDVYIGNFAVLRNEEGVDFTCPASRVW